MHRACRSRRRPFGRSRRCSRTPQRPCAWRAILWRTCRLSRMRGTAKRMILRTCFADARRYYEAADYTTACLETTFNGPPYSGYPQFCAPDALAYGLKTVGFNLLSTASNHSMDTWYSGLVRTLDVLDAAGLEHVGTYRHTAGARCGEDHRRGRHQTGHAGVHLQHKRPAGGQRAPVLRQRLHERLHDRLQCGGL